jgi:hypothetical protein
VWDSTGSRYGLGRGLILLVDGEVAARSPQLNRLTAPLPKVPRTAQPYEVIVSANADAAPFPKAEASFTAKYDSPGAALDGLCWFDPEYGDKWTSRSSWTTEDWFQVDFGAEKDIAAVRLFLYADDRGVEVPASYTIHYDLSGTWKPIQAVSVHPDIPQPNRANTVTFEPVRSKKIRIVFRHTPGIGVGLAQLQVLAPAASRG